MVPTERLILYSKSRMEFVLSLTIVRYPLGSLQPSVNNEEATDHK